MAYFFPLTTPLSFRKTRKEPKLFFRDIRSHLCPRDRPGDKPGTVSFSLQNQIPRKRGFRRVLGPPCARTRLRPPICSRSTVLGCPGKSTQKQLPPVAPHPSIQLCWIIGSEFTTLKLLFPQRGGTPRGGRAPPLLHVTVLLTQKFSDPPGRSAQDFSQGRAGSRLLPPLPPWPCPFAPVCRANLRVPQNRCFPQPPPSDALRAVLKAADKQAPTPQTRPGASNNRPRFSTACPPTKPQETP